MHYLRIGSCIYIMQSYMYTMQQTHMPKQWPGVLKPDRYLFRWRQADYNNYWSPFSYFGINLAQIEINETYIQGMNWMLLSLISSYRQKEMTNSNDVLCLGNLKNYIFPWQWNSICISTITNRLLCRTQSQSGISLYSEVEWLSSSLILFFMQSLFAARVSVEDQLFISDYFVF